MTRNCDQISTYSPELQQPRDKRPVLVAQCHGLNSHGQKETHLRTCKCNYVATGMSVLKKVYPPEPAARLGVNWGHMR
jgi:hypothetical protein